MYDVLFMFHLMIIEFMYLFWGHKINILFLFYILNLFTLPILVLISIITILMWPACPEPQRSIMHRCNVSTS